MRKTFIVLTVVLFGLAGQCLATDLIDASVDSISGPRLIPRDLGGFHALVRNVGDSVLDSLQVVWRDGDFRYAHTLYGLDRGETRVDSFRHSTGPGVHVLSCSAWVVGDMNPTNDCDTHNYFRERGTQGDMTVTHWFWPDTVDSGEVGYPRLRSESRNLTDSISFRLDYEIYSYTDSQVYDDWLYVERLAPGEDTTVIFDQQWHAVKPGLYQSWTYLILGDYVYVWTRDVRVRPSGAVAEDDHRSEAQRTQVTVCRGRLMPPGRDGAELLDICGRKVLDLQPGPNYLRHVAPGVYFVRSVESGERPAVTKVVIQR
jgi:hypothetical protein